MKIDCKQCILLLIMIYIIYVIGVFFLRKEFYKNIINVYKIKYMLKKMK